MAQIPGDNAGAKPRMCRPELPSMSVQHGPLPDLASWDKLKKQHEVMLIGVSDSTCENCCQTEGILQDFLALRLKHKGQWIPLVRIDLAVKSSAAILDKEDIHFDVAPRVIIFRDQRFFSYDAPFDRLDLLLHHFNRLHQPVVPLTTEEDVERFLALDQPDLSATPYWEGDYNTTFLRQMSEVPSMAEQWAASKMKTRVVCFVYDKQEYKEELATVRAEARFLATRDNLRVGIVDNPRLVKKIKASKYGHTLFPEVGLSALVLRRYDGVFRIHDLNGDSFVSPALWVNKQSLREVEELHSESYRIMELLRQPMFLAFVDFVDPRWASASHAAVQVLREVAPKYSHVLGFFYVNNTAFWQRKRVLGVTWDELPAMAFNFQGDASRVMTYPRGREISKAAIFDFMDDLLTGRGGANGKANYEKYTVAKDFSKTRNDTEIETVYLKQTQLADRSTFASLVYSEGYDVLLLLYTTEVVHEGQRAVAVQYNLVADAFQRLLEAQPEHPSRNVRVVAYDVNVNAFPEGIEFTLDLPQILVFPAYNKRPPYRRYTGQAAVAGPILLWLQAHADVKFTYPVDVSRVGYPKEQIPQAEQVQETREQAEDGVNEEL